MNKELCFYLDSKMLFLDKVLVSFNDTPIFFVCCDANQTYYIALCVDIDALEYIIVECSLRALLDMLSGKIEMRSPFTSTESFWHVNAGSSVYDDVTEKLPITALDDSELPLSNAYYEIITDSDKEYVDRIRSEFLKYSVFKEIKVNPEVFELFDTMAGLLLTGNKPIERYIDISPVQSKGFKAPKKEFVGSKSTQHFSYKEQLNNCTAIQTAEVPMFGLKEDHNSSLLAA